MRDLLLAALLAGAAAPEFAAGQEQDSGEGHGLHIRNATSDESRSEARQRATPQARMREERGDLQGSGGPARAGFMRPDAGVVMDRPSRGVGMRGGDGAVERTESAPSTGDGVQLSRDVPSETRAERPQRSFEPRMVRAPSQGEERGITRRDREGRAFGIVREPVDAGEIQSERTLGDGSSIGEGRTADPVRVDRPAIDERNLRRAPFIGEQSTGGLVQQRRDTPRVFEPAERRISRTPILGTEPPIPHTATAIAARPQRHWRTDWRRNDRYDSHNWRSHHRSNFHLGFYDDPFGWNYFRYGIGWRLWPSYYGSRYWLSDVARYRLPVAYGPYQWVRYYNDAVLVNIYTGEVADIVYDFFW